MKIEKEIAQILTKKGLSMGTAESCTGGCIAEKIISIPGSSSYFKGGIVAYCNSVKHNVLGVSSENLEKYGAVSKAVVEEMVKGAIKVIGCQCAVATSGIAGPGGGSDEKPVGTVWIAAAYNDVIISECYHFEHDRAGNINASAEMALQMLKNILEKFS